MNILVYGDSMSWGIIPGTRNRLLAHQRWTGVLQASLGSTHRVIEECLNGRTTQFEDANRPARNGLEHIQMLVESHAPIDLVIVMLGINDFQDVIGASSKESALGLASLVSKIQSLCPEPMQAPAELLVVIPPQIQQPLGKMAEKFSGYQRGNGTELEYARALEEFNLHTLKASDFVSLSKIDGVHLDETEHLTLGKAIATKVIEIATTKN